MDSREQTGGANKSFGSTDINSGQSDDNQDIKTKLLVTELISFEDSKNAVKSMNEKVPNVKRSQMQQTRQIISGRQLQKLDKNDNPVFVAIIRQTNESPQRRGNRGNKRSPHRVANFAAAHGMTEGEKRKINHEIGPKKDIITIGERQQQLLSSVPVNYRKDLESLIKEYRDIFPEKLPKGVPPSREVQHHIEIEPGSKPPY